MATTINITLETNEISVTPETTEAKQQRGQARNLFGN